MKISKTILLVGACGSGKTWVMKQLLDSLDNPRPCKVGKIHFRLSNAVAILGKYDGSTFEGSDKLSMAVMSDVDALKAIQLKHNLTVVCEGDRFTNATFVGKFAPTVVKILDSGDKGRKQRGSTQTERHIKAISTRVANVKHHYAVPNSTAALETIKTLLNE